jgi:hypothetical protein
MMHVTSETLCRMTGASRVDDFCLRWGIVWPEGELAPRRGRVWLTYDLRCYPGATRSFSRR